MITLFENFLDIEKDIIVDKTIKEFTSLFYRKICEYGDVVGKNYVDRGAYETEFIENNQKYIFTIILKEEVGEITLTLKSSFSNDSIFFKTLLEYLNDSEYFENIKLDRAEWLRTKFKILGTPEEVEEDMKTLEMMIHANKYNV